MGISLQVYPFGEWEPGRQVPGKSARDTREGGTRLNLLLIRYKVPNFFKLQCVWGLAHEYPNFERYLNLVYVSHCLFILLRFIWHLSCVFKNPFNIEPIRHYFVNYSQQRCISSLQFSCESMCFLFFPNREFNNRPRLRKIEYIDICKHRFNYFLFELFCFKKNVMMGMLWSCG